MIRKTRFRILLVCIICFLIGVPYIVLYSLGYRVDFVRMKIFATGGIYVRSFPSADQIIIDSKNFVKPGIFANDVFVPNLLPLDHSILIKKDGYYDYSKTLPVQEKLATKLENVQLFKKNIAFTQLVDASATTTLSPFATVNQPDKFIIKTNNLYYSSTKQNADLSAVKKTTAVLKNLVAFTLSGNNIVWISTTGTIYQADLNGIISGTVLAKDYTKLVINTLKITKTGNYKITIYGQNTFINNNGALLVLNTETKVFDSFAKNIKDIKFSPDGKNLIYFDAQKIYLYSFADKTTNQIFSGNQITDCIWFNNDYIVFVDGNKITISEIDYRGNINSVTLPSSAILADKTTLSIKSPQIIFNSQENKLYILSEKTLLATTDKLMP